MMYITKEILNDHAKVSYNFDDIGTMSFSYLPSLGSDISYGIVKLLPSISHAVI